MSIQATLTTSISVPKRILPKSIFDLAFSPDGRWLALATDSKRGVPLVESPRGERAGRSVTGPA